jgi:4-amino-4-deoxy-L-arabinose transferase-like glycosyltransferase
MTRHERPLFAGSARSGSTELAAITAGIVVFCGLGVISSLGPASARFVELGFAALGGAAVLALALGAVWRELRVRRRLAAIKPLTPEEAERRRPTCHHAPIGDRP